MLMQVAYTSPAPIPPSNVVVDLVVPRQCAGVGTCRAGAHGRAPGLEDDDGLLLGDAFGGLNEGSTVFEILKMHGDALGVVVLLKKSEQVIPVSYTHLRAHETVLDLVCR